MPFPFLPLFRRFACGLLAVGLLAAHVAQAAGSSPEPSQPAVASGPWSPLTLNKDVSADTAQRNRHELAVQRAAVGYLYALPAFLHARQRYEFVSTFARYMSERGNPYGQFLLIRTPAPLSTRDTMPNNDTLYGGSFLDLSAGPVVLSVPPMPGRYYSLTLMDAYFYPVEYIGSRTVGQQGGRYLIVGPHWQGPVPAGIDRVYRSTTPSLSVYQRIYFRSRADVPEVVQLQDQITFTPLARYLDPTAVVAAPDTAPALRVNPLQVSDPVQVLQIANRYMADNPPPEQDRSLLQYIAPLGIGPGLPLPTDEAALAVLREGAAMAGRTMTSLLLDGFPVRNGWQVPPTDLGRRSAVGGIATQAMVQLRSIGINWSEEAVYYTAYADAQGHHLNGNRSYTLTFPAGQLPPVVTDQFGFWSVTLYDRAQGRFVDNPAHKYVVRSADPLQFNADGSLTLYIQPTPPADPAQMANWLPSVAGADFMLNLRIFVGGPEVLSGAYTPPELLEAGAAQR